MIIQAIDPAESTGVCTLNTATGTFQTLAVKLKGKTLAERIQSVAEAPITRTLVDVVVVELPKVYPNSKADPNGLISLAVIAGALASRYRGTKLFLVHPQAWKGQKPKSVTLREMVERWGDSVEALTADEVDALGIATWVSDIVETHPEHWELWLK